MIDATVAAISIKMTVIVNTLVRIVISPSWIVVILVLNQASRPVGGVMWATIFVVIINARMRRLWCNCCILPTSPMG
jgi:hypothetical protein